MKLDPLLREKLRIDPPNEIIRVIIEFYNVARPDIVRNVGAEVVGISRILPYVYANATREQIAILIHKPEIKKIYLSAPTKSF